MLKRLHHIGIAVRTLNEGVEAWSAGGIGLQEEGREDVLPRRTRVAMFPIGESRIELLEPMDDDSPVGRFLASKGPGIHHICFEVDDINAECARLRGQGVRLLFDEPQEGAHGASVMFLHPKDTGGVLIELSEFPSATSE